MSREGPFVSAPCCRRWCSDAMCLPPPKALSVPVRKWERCAQPRWSRAIGIKCPPAVDLCAKRPMSELLKNISLAPTIDANAWSRTVCKQRAQPHTGTTTDGALGGSLQHGAGLTAPSVKTMMVRSIFFAAGERSPFSCNRSNATTIASTLRAEQPRTNLN